MTEDVEPPKRPRMDAAELVTEYDRGRRDFGGIDLSGADLTGVALNGIVLAQSDLSECDLRGASLRGADLSGAVMQGGKLDRADLSGARLTGTRLTRTSLHRSKLINADLRTARAQDARWRQADLRRANLRGTTLVGCDLRKANLEYADMADADLTGAVVWGSRLGNTSLKGATIKNTQGWISLSTWSSSASHDQVDTVRENAREATKHVGVLFLTQLTIALYGLFTVLSVSDAEFLGSIASIKLPVIDVSVRTSIFFAALPIILCAAQVYYLFYYRVSSRLWRVLETSSEGDEGIGSAVSDSADLRYPWIGLLILQPGLGPRIARIPFFLLSWATTPLLLLVAWFKTAPFRSTIALWIRDGAPAGYVFGIGFMLTLPLFCTWAAYESALERGVVEVRRIAVMAAAMCGAIAMAVGVVTSYPTWHRLQLVNAEISRRPSNAEQDPVGAILPHVALPGSKARRAYLALANLNEANLLEANLFGAVLNEAYAVDAVFDGANLSSAKAAKADASGARFRGAFLGFSDWSGAQLVCADFSRAKMRKASFVGANLAAAKLVGAMLEEADFRDADLRHADLSESFTSEARFDGSQYDAATSFPNGVIPAGARLVEASQQYRCN